MNDADKVTIRYSNLELIRDLARLIRPYRARFWGATVIRLAGDLAWLYPPFALASIVTFLTAYHPGQPVGALWLIVLVWAAVILTRALSQFFAKFLGYQVSEKIALDLSVEAVDHLFRLDMHWHERENSGNKIKRINNAAIGVDRVVRIWFDNLIEIAVNFVGISFIIFALDRVVLASLVAFLVVYFVVASVMTRRAAAASFIVNEGEEEMSGLMFEAMHNIRSVKIMAMATTLSAIVRAQAVRLFDRIRTRIFRYQSRNSTLSTMAYGFRLGVIAFIIVGILHGQYEVGFLILFNGYFGNIWESVDELSNATQNLISSKFSIARLRTILDEPVGIDDEAGKVDLPPDWKTIEFRNVSFSYGGTKALEDISFTVRRGERVGIVGLSGAGKSTLFKLLLKEREEFTGDILFDGVSLKSLKRSDYFRHVSAVLQDTEVFNFSLRENITITNPDEQGDAVLLDQAVKTAHVSDFLGKLPQGLETVIGEKGIKLSGGERQRLGIARAIFRRPELLLLDEATSHLDSESEEKIRNSLEAFFEKVTAIVIAHRLSTIRQMDRILVIEDGTLIESGTFSSLYKKRGRFYDLWEKQRL